MGEDIGSEMLFRHFGHLLRYCEPAIRRAVPLALGLISVSNPQLNILDTLTKFSHDTDTEVAHNSIFALGLVSCIRVLTAARRGGACEIPQSQSEVIKVMIY